MQLVPVGVCFFSPPDSGVGVIDLHRVKVVLSAERDLGSLTRTFLS